MSETGILQQLFESEADNFRRHYWPHRAYHYRGKPSRLGLFRRNPDLQNVSSLLSWAEFTNYDGFSASLPTARDESQSFKTIKPLEALWAFKSGMTITCSLHEAMPEIKMFVRQMKVALGLPSFTHVRNITYCSPAGEGTSLHFDANVNFVVQLAGEKKWVVAPNFDVENPTDRYSTRMEQVPLRLRSYAPHLPRELPGRSQAESLDVHMKPGDVLFVPRGWWHSTTAVSDSLQVNFTSSSPTWTEVLLGAMAQRLEQEADWRGLAYDLESEDPEKRASSVDHLRTLVSKVPGLLATMDPDSFIAGATAWNKAIQKTGRASTTFKRDISIDIVFRDDIASFRSAQGRDVKLSLEQEFIPLASWICSSTEPFTNGQLEDLFPLIDVHDRRRVISILCSQGVLFETNH